ncbi:polysaccharide pyruvyl transferase family protein [Streptomyces sp. KLOTTS4A1]|uniref:polysaccharide pyruvyl transferase family protein n=1 Tax=Streptomyces sp. KLOTTS4A1 TaxID=3390996 RepID=UPI0039F5E4D0
MTTTTTRSAATQATATTSRTAEVASSATSASGFTGAPRTAFLCRYGPGLPDLLRSLALTNPEQCEDFLVVSGAGDIGSGEPGNGAGEPGSGGDDLDEARRLYPRIVAEGDPAAYDRVIRCEPGWTIGPKLTVQLEPGDEERRLYRLTDTAFRAAYAALPGDKHPELLLHLGRPLFDERPKVDLARQLGLAYRSLGRYEEAVEVLTAVRARADQPRFHETLGSALLAVSRYDEAATHLLLATADPTLAPKAFSQLARLAWLRGEDGQARRFGREGLQAEPGNRVCRTLQRPEAYGVPEPPPPGDGIDPGRQLAHVALYASGQENAGDKELPDAVRRCLSPLVDGTGSTRTDSVGTDNAGTGTTRAVSGDPDPRLWHPVPVHRLFDEAALDQVNARRGLIVGGGGLFLPDTMPNGNSGWQWNIPDELLAQIEVPLAVFAVGFNLFEGQGYHREGFRRSLELLVEKSAFFGLRNRGSVERVRDLLPVRLQEKVVHQPCPTTLTRLLVPENALDRAVESGEGNGEKGTPAEPAPTPTPAPTVHINCAYDRAALRFGSGYGSFLAQLAQTVRALRPYAEVRCAAHTPADEQFTYDLRREHGLTVPVDPLYDRSNAQILALYRRTRLVIGMRGHATMIPFGCGTPVISLVSHPKMAYFLADIARPQWGVSVHDPRLAERLTELAVGMLTEHAAAAADVRDRQRELWAITRTNLDTLHRRMSA